MHYSIAKEIYLTYQTLQIILANYSYTELAEPGIKPGALWFAGML